MAEEVATILTLHDHALFTLQVTTYSPGCYFVAESSPRSY